MAKKPSQANEIRAFILWHVTKNPNTIASLAGEQFGVTRQTTHRHLRKLVELGLLRATGNTQARAYFLKPLARHTQTFPVARLEEDVVWREAILPHLGESKRNILDICQFGFTEVVNNVIDHSESEECRVSVEVDAINLNLRVIDQGVGIFNKIQQAMGLSDPRHSILELSKGKFTTDPENHSGEGIYFTSRAFDDFSVLSGHLYFDCSTRGGEWLLEAEDRESNFDGTSVRMTINRVTDRELRSVFDAATSGDDLGFTKTHVPIALVRYGDENLVSRSQAKRLLTRFDRFNEVMLDFKGVDRIGQAFADEIFRVFANAHPETRIININERNVVRQMIERAQATAR